MVFEMAIPLAELLDEKTMKMDELLLLNINIRGIENPQPERSHHSDEQSGWDNNNMNGMGAMGSNARMNPNSYNGFQHTGDDHRFSQAERNALFESISFKQKFKLVSSSKPWY